jgi:drug/metabolite transporter (DMT)-like permease
MTSADSKTLIDPDPKTSGAPGWLVWVALWIVYIVWGSTYLAIRVTVETMPPLLTAATRFLIAGGLMYLFLWWRKGSTGVMVTRDQILASTGIGSLLLLGGNGLVSVAEQHVPSGLTALIIASVPLWVILLRYAAREKVPTGTLIGVAVGFAGVTVLLLPGDRPEGVTLGPLLLVVAASMSWATGSFLSKKVPLPSDPFVSTALQMMGGGLVMLVAGALRGEATGLDLAAFSGASLAGLGYLIVFGSWLAFTAYVWLLQNAPISKVATYAYVNPVVAIFLGWLILSEGITLTIVLGATVIVGSVAAIVKMESATARRAVAQEAAHLTGAPATDTRDVVSADDSTDEPVARV